MKVPLEELGIDGTIILKGILQNQLEGHETG
jgi:hypothetical protein